MTTARVAVEEDRHRRMRNYLLAMGLRIVGFPLSVWLLLNGYLVPGIVLAAVATVIPSVAVVIANAVDRRGTSVAASTPVSPVQGLAPPPTGGPAPERADRAAPGPTDPIAGTVVSRHETPYPPRAEDPRAQEDEGPADRGDVGREAS